MEEREDLEHVPWAELMAETEPEDRRRRAIYLAAALIGAVAVGIFVARSWWAVPGAVDPVAPGASEVAAGTLPPSPPSTFPLYSEADLMADPLDPAARAAVMRAEWFVTDYFTADLEPSGSAEVRAALPPSVAGDLSLDIGDAVSYVEWARAFRVEEAGDGRYRVAVAFRTLGAPPDRGFSRQPVRAVEVLVESRANGGAVVVDLPSPTMVPAGPEPTGWEGVPSPAPQRVIDEASTRASLWGSEPRIVGAWHLDGEWRVVLTVADSVGARWPLALRVAEEG